MITIRIEREIINLETCLAAFARFDPARAQAGVRTRQIQQPIDDSGYIVSA